MEYSQAKKMSGKIVSGSNYLEQAEKQKKLAINKG